MLVAIISDIHNNTVNLQKVLDYCADKKIVQIICCGDLASMETLDFLCDNFKPLRSSASQYNIFYTFGNMDNEQMNQSFFPNQGTGEKYKNALIFKNHGKTKIDNKQIAFVHFPNKAKELCETGKYNFVFYGHTHKPWMEKVSDCVMLNPGNVAGEIYPPTFAVWNTTDDSFELMKINELK